MTPHYITSHHTISHHTISHHTTLHYITSHSTTSHSTTPLHMIINQAVITSVQPSPSPVHQAPSSTQQHPACHSIPSSYGWSCLFIPPSCTIPCCHFIMASWGEQLAYQSNHHWLEQSPKNKKQKTKMLLSVESYQEKTKNKKQRILLSMTKQKQKQKAKRWTTAVPAPQPAQWWKANICCGIWPQHIQKKNKYQY